MESKIEKSELENFCNSSKNFFDLQSAEQIDYFLYFLTIEKKLNARATEIRNCFLLVDLTPYSNVNKYLLENLKSKGNYPPKFIRIGDYYQLHRRTREQIDKQIIKKPLRTKAKNDLRQLLTRLNNTEENEFLNEAIMCFEIEAYRASIVMVWNLTLNHLYEFILKYKVDEFNLVLASNNDRRVKITSISKKDDFSEIPENKFIEFCRSADIVTNDIRKKLDNKLGIRNTYAHPSNVKMLEIIATEFIDDLINNVLLKYKI